jgi:uncharacterized protein (DUF302 family)
MDRVEAIVEHKGLNVFARVDHAAGATENRNVLRPTEMLIFGHPQGGTPWMACAQSVGIDWPLKALAWEDSSGQVRINCNDPAHLARRHDALSCPVAGNRKRALTRLAEATVAKWSTLNPNPSTGTAPQVAAMHRPCSRSAAPGLHASK